MHFQLPNLHEKPNSIKNYEQITFLLTSAIVVVTQKMIATLAGSTSIDQYSRGVRKKTPRIPPIAV